MMRTLLLEEGGLIQVESVSMPVATFAKFQPQSEDFLDISNPKAVYPSIGLPFQRGGGVSAITLSCDSIT